MKHNFRILQPSETFRIEHGDVKPSDKPDLRGHMFNSVTGTLDTIGPKGEVLASHALTGERVDDRQREEAEWRHVWGVK